jgi:carboxypeptidase Q
MARPRCSALLAAAAAVGAQTNVLYPITSDMSAAASQVVAYATTPGPESTLMWDRLAEMTDTFGGRLGGSASLEAALDWVRDTARNADGLTVTEHAVSVPYWTRGDEWARMVSPRNKSLHFLGLGMSIGTGGAVITADVLVVASFAELDAVNASVPGKIVLFNPPWVSYGVTVAYRSQCAVAAAKYGAVAALIRSVGPYGLQTPHTGGSQTATIPAGAVSMEDASQMARMQARGQRVRGVTRAGGGGCGAGAFA